MWGFAYVRECVDIILRKLAIHNEAAQCVTLPRGAVMRPFEYVLKDCH